MTSKSRSAQVPFSKWLILSILCALTVTNSNTEQRKLKFPKFIQCNATYSQCQTELKPELPYELNHEYFGEVLGNPSILQDKFWEMTLQLHAYLAFILGLDIHGGQLSKYCFVFTLFCSTFCWLMLDWRWAPGICYNLMLGKQSLQWGRRHTLNRVSFISSKYVSEKLNSEDICKGHKKCT